MPYEEHKLFTDPKETNLLWRYMDFTKFVSIISTQSLFFPSTRILQKIDPWEGTELKKELEYRLKEELRMKSVEDPSTEFEYLSNIVRGWKCAFKHEVDINYISC